MKPTKYLYGDDKPLPVPKNIIDSRITILNSELASILLQEWLIRDGKRANDIIKAIKFWESINER